jgi:hypothetical protein
MTSKLHRLLLHSEVTVLLCLFLFMLLVEGVKYLAQRKPKSE